jgi:hypothetical protein
MTLIFVVIYVFRLNVIRRSFKVIAVSALMFVNTKKMVFLTKFVDISLADNYAIFHTNLYVKEERRCRLGLTFWLFNNTFSAE